MICGIISDIFLSTELIPKKRLKKWIQRPGFNLRKVVILKWIVLGNILTLGYKTTLLSSLIPIRYEDTTIKSLDDLDKSGLPLIIPRGSSLHDHLANDAREIVTRITGRLILLDAGDIPRWALEM